MSTEMADIHDFVKAIEPFNQLADEVIGQVISHISICYVRAGEALPPPGIEQPHVYFLRKGALAYYNGEGELLGKFGEGDICTVFCNNIDERHLKVIPEEDTLLCAIDYQQLQQVIKDYPYVLAFFMDSAAQRLQHKVASINEEAIMSSTLMNTSIGDFYHAPAVTIDEQQSIQQAAKKMTELGFSCLMVLAEGQLAGIVTDKDLRRRCIAEGVDFARPVSEIMTTDLQLIDINHSAYDALTQMTSQHIHHLPVTKNGQLAGMITVTDLMNQEGLNAVNMTSTIGKASSVSELAKIALLLPRLQIRMAKLGTTADHVGKTISAITGSFTMRLIAMAKQEFGPAPVPFAWLAAGSQARQEQFAHSDQDNALIISDDMQPEDDVWFAQLATFVCDGLAACGFIYCPGNVMATNAEWRQPARVWGQYFDKWITQPEPLALMHSSVFFDLNTVCGDASLLTNVRANMLAKTKTNTLFIAHLSGNALKLRPPLGFFRDFVLIANGKHKKTLDLKHNGIAPIVDLARIYALSEGITAVNTIERLRLAAGTPSLSTPAAANLIDAYEFLGMLRVEHQVQQLQANVEADNYLAPKEISRLEREHLKDAFKVIKSMQSNRQTTYS